MPLFIILVYAVLLTVITLSGAICKFAVLVESLILILVVANIASENKLMVTI